MNEFFTLLFSGEFPLNLVNTGFGEVGQIVFSFSFEHHLLQSDNLGTASIVGLHGVK